MWNKAAIVLALAAGQAFAQQIPLGPRTKIAVNLPEDGPVQLVTGEWGNSSATIQGAAMLLDFKTALVLRNMSNRIIRGITLQVVAHEVTPGGKASISVPSLNIQPRQNVNVQIDLRLLRPAQTNDGPIAEVNLDGVLYDDLSFFGPNKLNSRRSMMVWEMEARRDRQFFRGVLDGMGTEGLRQEMVASLSRQVDRAQMNAQVSRTNRVGNMQAEREVQVAFLHLPDSPVQLQQGFVRVSGNEARSPQLAVVNLQAKPVRSVEIGWVVKDSHGAEYFAGAMPATVALGPHQSGNLTQQPSLLFKQRSGQPIELDKLTSYVNNVEYDDGTMWVPGQRELSDSKIRRVLTPSPEEQRLAELYRKKGLAALIEELKKF